MFKVFAPVAMAGLGDLPETLMTRSVIVRMRKRLPTERVESFRQRVQEDEAQPLKEVLKEWA